jgi:hypothetical protein
VEEDKSSDGLEERERELEDLELWALNTLNELLPYAGLRS